MTLIGANDHKAIRCIVQLAREIWPEHYHAIIGPGQAAYMLEKFQSEEAIAAQLLEGFQYFILQDPNGEPAGYLAVLPRSPELFLSKFYLLKHFRGKGHGRKMLRHVEALARTHGCLKIVLTVNTRNTQTIAAYQKMGFHITAPKVQDIGGGYCMDDFQMEKELGPAA